MLLGSSLTVTPAADIPRMVAEQKRRLVIGNLQRTPLYSIASLNIHAFSDTIMQGLMERLEIPIPTWIVRRRVRVTRKNTSDCKSYRILIEGRDPDNTNIPFTLFKSIKLSIGEQNILQTDGGSFIFEIPSTTSEPINFRFEFFGHYNEIPFDLNYASIDDISSEEEFYLFYNPKTGQWRKTTQAYDFPI